MVVDEQVRAWRPAVPGIAEVLHATFQEYRYPPHVHDTWTILLLERGIVRYDLDRRSRVADAASVTLLPPGIAHDGHSATAEGFRKQVLYVDVATLPEHLTGVAVDRPVNARPAVLAGTRRLHRLLRSGDDAVGGEAEFALVVELLLADLGASPESPPAAPSVARRLREHLDATDHAPITLADAAAAIGASPGHAARSFTAHFGVTPHQYAIGRKVDAARRLLLEGMPIAAVASSVGFHDQAHLTRHFRRHVGVTPGRFRG